MTQQTISEDVWIQSGAVNLPGMIEFPADAKSMVVFAHGSGSSRYSTRNGFVAGVLREASIGTLLLDLLTPEEDANYPVRFDIDLLTQRLGDAIRHVEHRHGAERLPLGLFGASTGAAAALRVAARMPKTVRALVSRGGRPDLAGSDALRGARAPSLLIVGGRDHGVIELNQAAYEQITCVKEIAIVPGATHLFEEPGALEQVAQLAGAWFSRYLNDESEFLRPAFRT